MFGFTVIKHPDADGLYVEVRDFNGRYAKRNVLTCSNIAN